MEDFITSAKSDIEIVESPAWLTEPPKREYSLRLLAPPGALGGPPSPIIRSMLGAGTEAMALKALRVA